MIMVGVEIEGRRALVVDRCVIRGDDSNGSEIYNSPFGWTHLSGCLFNLSLERLRSISQKFVLILDAFAYSRKAPLIFFISVRLTVCLNL